MGRIFYFIVLLLTKPQQNNRLRRECRHVITHWQLSGSVNNPTRDALKTTTTTRPPPFENPTTSRHVDDDTTTLPQPHPNNMPTRRNTSAGIPAPLHPPNTHTSSRHVAHHEDDLMDTTATCRRVVTRRLSLEHSEHIKHARLGVFYMFAASLTLPSPLNL